MRGQKIAAAQSSAEKPFQRSSGLPRDFQIDEHYSVLVQA